MSRSVKNKLVECISINLSKELYGDASRKDQCYIEAEDLLKTLLISSLVDKVNGDPLQYVEMLENVEEILGLDYYEVKYIKKLVFGN